MPSLKNTHASMEIGYVWQMGKANLYIQVGNERKYYGTLSRNKASDFLDMLKKWDEAGGNDG